MKDILGYEGQYSVTRDGKVYSHKRKRFLSPTNLKGYKRVKLRDSNNNQKISNQLIHRLVAKAFIPNPNNKLEINHKNSIRDDNRVDNLEWATRSENNQHAWTYGNKVFKITEKYLNAVRKNINIARKHRLNNIRNNNATRQ
jgi:hypothetical protein